MPVQIGSVTHTFSDPTGLLSDCHRRIEMFIDVLKAVADGSDQQLTNEKRSSLATALRYFREAAPKHTADEEESLFPRLRAMNVPELKVALDRLEGLEQDHRWAESLHETADRLGNRYLDSGRLSPDDAQIFRNAVHQLRAMYRRHIDIEDREVFPVVARYLSGEQKEQIAREMASRRQVKAVAAP